MTDQLHQPPVTQPSERHFKRVYIIINPAAGKDEPMLNIMNRIFHSHEIEWEIAITYGEEDACRLAREAANRDDVDLVIAYGGDGTIMEVVNGVYGTEKPMAILRGGTGNAAAAEIKVPEQLETALEQISTGRGKIRQVDVGEIVGEDKVFLLRADIGISEVLDKTADRDLKSRYGMLAYILAILKAFPEKREVHYRLLIDGREITYDGAACLVVNMGNTGAFDLTFSEAVRYDDGWLDVFLAKNDFSTALGVLASAVHITHLENVLQHHRGKDIRVEAVPIQKFSCDGERTGTTPFHVRIVPGAVRVFVPEVIEA